MSKYNTSALVKTAKKPVAKKTSKPSKKAANSSLKTVGTVGNLHKTDLQLMIEDIDYALKRVVCQLTGHSNHQTFNTKVMIPLGEGRHQEWTFQIEAGKVF